MTHTLGTVVVTALRSLKKVLSRGRRRRCRSPRRLFANAHMLLRLCLPHVRALPDRAHGRISPASQVSPPVLAEG